MKKIFQLFFVGFMSVCIVLISNVSYSQSSQQSELQIMENTLGKFSYSTALQAANWGLPIVIMYNLRYNDALKPGAKSKPNQIWRLEDITTPTLAVKAGYVTPNVNVIYGFGFLDLSQEPIILTAPDSNNRYYMIQFVDMYTNSFSYVGGMATGYKGGKYAIVGPNWNGELPSDVKRIDAPTPWILIQPRVHVINEADLSAAKKVLNEITVQGLAEYMGKTPTQPKQYEYMTPDLANPKLPVSAVDFKDPVQFWQVLSAAINENPPPKDQIKALLPLFNILGIKFGKQWDPKDVSPVVLESMKKAAKEIGSMSANLPIGTLVNNWSVPPPGIGNAGTNYYLRSVIARVGLTANIPQEAIYFLTMTDSTSQNLMSNKKYTITFKELPPYISPGFWSLTLYNANNNYTVSNPINRYALGNDNQLKSNGDGTVTIYIQSTSPGKDKESNWLPSGNSNQPIYLILRSYAPGKALVESLTNPKIYSIPPVVELN